MVDDLLTLARADSVETRQLTEQIDFSELCWSLLLQFEPVAYEKSLILDSDIMPQIFLIGDRTSLRQLVQILFDNACKYTNKQGHIQVELKKQPNGSVQFAVTNTGITISKEDLPHVFERFYRSDPARSGEGGFGLGLAIAKSIVERHHGTIHAESACGVTKFAAIFPKF